MLTRWVMMPIGPAMRIGRILDDFTCFGYEDWEDWDAGWWEAFDEDCSM